jgi:G:T-mismatch repair DNA endonuclease (very short patch repair protein)
MNIRNEEGRFVKGHFVAKGWGYQKNHQFSPRIWSKGEEELLRIIYPTKSPLQLKAIINSKTVEQINSKAHELHLYKTKETITMTKKGKKSHRKGLTIEEEYGLSRACEIRKKISESKKGKHPDMTHRKPSRYWLGKKLPKEMREKISNTLRNGASSFYRFKDHPEWRKRNLQSCMKRPTKPENILSSIISTHDLPFRYSGNGTVLIGRLNPDFVHNHDKKVIEVFGRAFHDPDYKYRFAEIPWYRQYSGRTLYYKQHGYDCLIFWEDQLHDENFVLNQVKGFTES